MKVFIPIFAASALLASTVSGWSGSASGNLQVKITISPECKIDSASDTTLDFGSHSLVNNDVSRDATIKVQCTKGTEYTIGLGLGANAKTGSERRMKRVGSAAGKEDYIPYQLYSDKDRQSIWGAGDVKTPDNSSTTKNVTIAPGKAIDSYLADSVGFNQRKTGTGSVQAYSVYGFVAQSAAGTAPAGEYTDTVAVTVSF